MNTTTPTQSPVNSSFISDLEQQLKATARSGARFASIRYRRTDGEVAHHVVLLGCDYGNALKSTLALVRRRVAKTAAQIEAKPLVVDSLRLSIEKNAVGEVNPNYTCAETYDHGVAGLMIHRETGQAYLRAYGISKRRISPPTIPAKTKKPSTNAVVLAKEEFKKGSPLGRIRQFTLSPETVEFIRIGGIELREEANRQRHEAQADE